MRWAWIAFLVGGCGGGSTPPGNGCVPTCGASVCGNDGCGGSCGSCGGGESCVLGACTTALCTPSCDGRECGDDGCGGSCGECDASQGCTDGRCTCLPDCSGESCGDDGCGGACGSCSGNQYCNQYQDSPFVTNPRYGTCQDPDWCENQTFSPDCRSGCCPDAPYRYSSKDELGNYQCSCRAACIPDQYEGCIDDSDCCSDSKCEYDDYGPHCVGGCVGKPCTASRQNGGECCESDPYCWGAMGCSSVGAPDGYPCADDTACGEGSSCVSGRCVAPCQPSCSGVDCGDDGCGGSCGTCASGSCVNGACCVPSCAGRSCGGDGCGGSCGSCSSGVCYAGSCCTPDCANKSCGDDGCGGSCGFCDVSQLCSSGSCVANPNYCDPVADTGCAPPNDCTVLYDGKTACLVLGDATQGELCPPNVDCAGGYACFSGTCRKICDTTTGEGCPPATTCQGVSGWPDYGACH